MQTGDGDWEHHEGEEEEEYAGVLSDDGFIVSEEKTRGRGRGRIRGRSRGLGRSTRGSRLGRGSRGRRGSSGRGLGRESRALFESDDEGIEYSRDLDGASSGEEEVAGVEEEEADEFYD